MPVEVFETNESRSTVIGANVGDQKGVLEYFVTGTANYKTAQSAVTAELPARFNYAATPSEMAIKPIAPKMWHAVVQYGHPSGGGGGKGGGRHQTAARMPRAVGQATWSFDTSGGTFRLYSANAQTKYGANAPDHGKAIQVTPDGVEGVDIIVPQLVITITQRFAGNALTLAYVKAIADLTGKTNNAELLGFPAGELLFLGGNGTQPVQWNELSVRTFGERDLSFSFACSPNRSSFEIDGITVTTKKGHDFLWLAYADQPDAGGNGIARTAVGAYVATVYESGDMSALGIVNPDNFPALAGDYAKAEAEADDQDAA